MSTRKVVVAAAALAFGAGVALAETPHLGKPVSPSDLTAWDLNVLPDGSNLPPGSGKPAEGQKIYAEASPTTIPMPPRCSTSSAARCPGRHRAR